MKYVAWKESYALGLPEIDSQHQELVETMNRLWSCLVVPGRGAEVAEILDELTDYTRTHFVAEETLMRIQNYPRLAEHIAEHQRFVDELTKARESLSRRPEMALQLVRFLHDWLVNHIDKSDRHYADFLAQARPAPGLLARLFGALTGRKTQPQPVR